MNVKFEKSIPQGVVCAPPSKSMTHRYLIGAYLSGSECTVDNISYSQDVLATINCLKSLGAEILEYANSVKITNGASSNNNIVLDCGESGSTLRFLIPIVLAKNIKAEFIGHGKLFERPLDIYEEICKSQGIVFEKNGNSLKVDGALKPGKYNVRGDISSQFISGLMFALCLFDEESEICVTGTFESRSYVMLTTYVLKLFGFNVEFEDNIIKVSKGKNTSVKEITAEGDCSNSAYVEGLRFCGGDLRLLGVDKNSMQGDVVYIDLFEKLSGGYCEIDISDCPDLGPILFVAAALNHGALINGTKRLRIKESDRVECMRIEFEKFGAELVVNDNSVKIPKCDLHAPDEALDAHNDHRILMALSVMLCKFGGTINGAQCVAKSYPDYFEVIQKLGAKFREV